MARLTTASLLLALPLLSLSACDGAGPAACPGEADLAVLVASADADTLDALAADVCPEDAAEPDAAQLLTAGPRPAGYVEGDAYPEDPFRWGCDHAPQDISQLTPQSCLIMLASCVDAAIEQCGADAKACQVLQQQCVANVESACWARLPG